MTDSAQLAVPHLDRRRLHERLASIVPFRFLTTGQVDELVARSTQRRYLPGEALVSQGDVVSTEVFVLLAGTAESVDLSRNPPFRVNVVEAVCYFGEEPALIGCARRYEVRALAPCAVLAIPGPVFIELLALSRPFAQAFGTKIREGLGLFDAFDRFAAEVHRGITSGHIEIRRLVEYYKALEPALHPLVLDEAKIDWPALSYALRRLPANVTRCFIFLLTDNLPSVYASPELLFPFVPTDARHRFVYEMMAGKDMVLVRSGISDIMDFLTCLCVFAVEGRKIRYRLNHPDLILAVSRLEPERGSPESELDPLSNFEGEDRQELEGLWPGCVVERLRELVFHRQAFSVDVRKQVNNYNGTLNDLWSTQVGDAAARLVGMSPADFPEDVEVHIISSNTHSVANCLNPFFIEHREDILGWADREGRRLQGWPAPMDEVYSLARDWFAAHPEQKREVAQVEERHGIIRLKESVTTGIQVQLIAGRGVCEREVDPGISLRACPERSFIVNIDFAFGEQAAEIMRSLLLLFGRNVRSINVIGKAGALEGARGDLLAPSAFIDQTDDAFQPLEELDQAAAARLETALPGRVVHAGPLLTVGGTLLQNRAMLHFYRKIWGCVGIEMEGIWYHRAILEARELGVLRADARARFLYYVSDLPLSPGERLSARLSPVEGVPPLYAATREILGGILAGDQR